SPPLSPVRLVRVPRLLPRLRRRSRAGPGAARRQLRHVALLSNRTRRRIADFDSRVDRAFDHVRGNPVADRVFYGASALGDWSLIWLILGALRGLRSERDWHAAVRVGGLLSAESILVNLGIKSLFRRTRPPWEVDRPLHLRRPR